MPSSLSPLLPLLVAALLAAPSASSPSLAGDWALEGEDLVVRITESSDAAAGVVLEGPEKLRGKAFLRGLRRDKGGGWRGELFAPRMDSFVPVTVRLEDGALKMKAGRGLLSRNLIWRRKAAETSRLQPQSAGSGQSGHFYFALTKT